MTPAIVAAAASELFCELAAGGAFAAWLISGAGVEVDADDMVVPAEGACLSCATCR